jgi:hypothetical protein
VLTSAEYASSVSIYMPIISVHTVLQLHNALATAAQKTAMSETATIRCPQSKSTYSYIQSWNKGGNHLKIYPAATYYPDAMIIQKVLIPETLHPISGA